MWNRGQIQQSGKRASAYFTLALYSIKDHAKVGWYFKDYWVKEFLHQKSGQKPIRQDLGGSSYCIGHGGILLTGFPPLLSCRTQDHHASNGTTPNGLSTFPLSTNEENACIVFISHEGNSSTKTISFQAVAWVKLTQNQPLHHFRELIILRREASRFLLIIWLIGIEGIIQLWFSSYIILRNELLDSVMEDFWRNWI